MAFARQIQSLNNRNRGTYYQQRQHVHVPEGITSVMPKCIAATTGCQLLFCVYKDLASELFFETTKIITVRPLNMFL